jgi:hypothetical protein
MRCATQQQVSGDLEGLRVTGWKKCDIQGGQGHQVVGLQPGGLMSSAWVKGMGWGVMWCSQVMVAGRVMWCGSRVQNCALHPRPHLQLNLCAVPSHHLLPSVATYVCRGAVTPLRAGAAGGAAGAAAACRPPPALPFA